MNVAGRDINRVCLAGTGFIGMGWAIVFARAGVEVRAYDVDPGQLDRLRERIAVSLENLKRVDWITENEAEEITRRIGYHPDLGDALEGVGYVQESVPERLAIKQAVFEELDRRLPAEVVIGSSASALPMTRIAEQTQHPERCVVVHPTNPPHIVPLVEIVPGERTSYVTVDFARQLMSAVGQSPIVCRKEIMGFVLNRLQMALEREAFYLLREGIASAADIDRTVSEGLGLRWALLGPFLVEETNADNVRVDLEKFGAVFQELFADICRPYDGPLSGDIDSVEEGVHELMGARTHDALLAYRDELVLRIRQMREAWKPSG